MRWIYKLCAWFVDNWIITHGSEMQYPCQNKEWLRAFMRDA